MRPSPALSLFALASTFALAVGCAAGQDIEGTGGAPASGGNGGRETTTACVPGKQIECPCGGGVTSVQACNAQGTGYGACQCGAGGTGGTGGTGSTGSSDPCGDDFCVGEETCLSCPADCGPCAPCTLAPSCANAQIPPATLTHVPELDTSLLPISKEAVLARLEARVARRDKGVRLLAAALRPARAGEPMIVSAVRERLDAEPGIVALLDRQLTKAGIHDLADLDLGDLEPPRATPLGNEFPGGTPECGAPLLRVRVSTVTVHEEDDDFANDIVYCALTSEAASASEIRVTPQTPNLDQGDSFTYPIEAGIFWGQQAPETPGGNLLLTYDCFENDSSSGYQTLLDSIGSAATQIGGVAGSYGWVFTVVGAVAPVIGDAIGMDGDDHLFNAQQVIPLDKQLDLTNGRFWSVRRHGTHLNSDWDWELRVEAWGCAEHGTL